MNNLKNIYIPIVVVLLACTVTIEAQQTAQTSFFTEGRTFWNPAWTGFDKSMNVNAFVRQQWLGFGSKAPRTVYADYQYPFVDYNMAIGGGLQYDQTGPISKKGVVLSYSYQVDEIGYNDGKFSLGLSAGGHQYVFDPSQEVINNEGDPLLAAGDQSRFYPAIGAGLFYQSGTDVYRNNTNFIAGLSFNQAYETNLLLDNINQKRISHLIFELGAQIYTYDYKIQPNISVNYSTPEILHVLGGINFEMKETFWAGVGYSNIQEFSIQGGYIFEDIGGRGTRLKVGALGNVGLGDRLTNFGPGVELFIRYELDMD